MIHLTLRSVTWAIEDLIRDYAYQIETHLSQLISFIETNHWRRNPAVLVGYRIAVFRKGISPSPTIVCGFVIRYYLTMYLLSFIHCNREIVEPSSSTGYSKIRVAFDSPEKVSSSANVACPPTSPTSPYFPSYGSASPIEQSRNGTISASDRYYYDSKESHQLHLQLEQESIIGEVTEPFWVQKQGQQWLDPDELFLVEAKSKVTLSDKQLFWEMIRAIIDLPSLAAQCNTKIKNAKDLTALLKGTEYRILWSPAAPESLPKEVCAELIRAAYVS